MRIAPAEIADAEIVDLVMPRADFRGAAYQWLIGLLQTVASPTGEDDWLDWYEAPPSPERLMESFAPFGAAFELDGTGPCFMQDRDPLDSAALSSVSSLLVDAPGANGIKNNTDFFIKRGGAERLCRIARRSRCTRFSQRPSWRAGFAPVCAVAAR